MPKNGVIKGSRHRTGRVRDHVRTDTLGSFKAQAVHTIQIYAREKIPESDQEKFIVTVEKELRSLHEGNIDRFGLRPFEYESWQEFWK